EPLHGAAFDLALDERRVDRPADVEALVEALYDDFACLVVDLDLGRAGRVRDRGVGREVDLARLRFDDRRIRLQLRADTGDQLAVTPRRRRGHVRDGDLLLRRAARDHLAVDDLEVGRVDLELLRGDLEQLLARVPGRLQHRVSGDERRAR